MFSNVMKKYPEKWREILQYACLTKMTDTVSMQIFFLGHGDFILDNI